MGEAETESAAPLGAAVPREAAVSRLVRVAEQRQLRTSDVQLVAEGLGVSVRTVWRWVERARHTGQTAPSGRARFEVSDALRERLAFWRGNVRAVHRELVIAAGVGGPPAPSLPTLHRAIQRDVLPGDRAGLRRGELARRGYDVFLQGQPSPPGMR